MRATTEIRIAEEKDEYLRKKTRRWLRRRPSSELRKRDPRIIWVAGR